MQPGESGEGGEAERASGSQRATLARVNGGHAPQPVRDRRNDCCSCFTLTLLKTATRTVSVAFLAASRLSVVAADAAGNATRKVVDAALSKGEREEGRGATPDWMGRTVRCRAFQRATAAVYDGLVVSPASTGTNWDGALLNPRSGSEAWGRAMTRRG